MLYIDSLEVEDHVLDKIESKHGISLSEAEEACFSARRHIRRSRGNLYKIFGRTYAGRYLLVVLVEIGEGCWRIVTARDMTDTERRLYRKAVGEG